MSTINIADIRKDYKLQTLNEADVLSNPIAQFTQWWNEAVNSQIDEVNAMTLATATKTGIPSVRIVLLKGYDENGFVFFTNYESKKGKQLTANEHAAILFFWKELERQVNISGTIKKISETDSDAYFNSRPVGSRIGAWSSPQSTIINSREILEENAKKYAAEFGENVPRPPHWGGFVLQPTAIEFWQGRSSRLHDRLYYSLQPNNSWKLERLAP